APGGQQDDGGDRRAEQGGAPVVDGVLAPLGRDVEDAGDDEQGDDADGDVDVEDPAPAQVLGEDPTEQRPDDTGGGEDGPEVAHVAAPLPGADDVAHDGLGAHDETAGAHALESPEEDD